VQYVDCEHVALTYQFFNKTRENILANPRAASGRDRSADRRHVRLTLHYLRTETAGPLFESMKAKLAGIASHVGMDGVFRLLGADLYRVTALEPVPGEVLAPRASGRNLLAALRAISERIRHQYDLDLLLNAMLAALEAELEIRHAMVLLYDGNEGVFNGCQPGLRRSGIAPRSASAKG